MSELRKRLRRVACWLPAGIADMRATTLGGTKHAAKTALTRLFATHCRRPTPRMAVPRLPLGPGREHVARHQPP
jgi:hypothetical protein